MKKFIILIASLSLLSANCYANDMGDYLDRVEKFEEKGTKKTIKCLAQVRKNEISDSKKIDCLITAVKTLFLTIQIHEVFIGNIATDTGVASCNAADPTTYNRAPTSRKQTCYIGN